MDSTTKITREIVQKLIRAHGELYDYSLVKYINGNKQIDIICKTHGIFKQTARAHMAGQGCPKCTQSGNWIYGRSSQERFISRAKAIHGDKYDYTKVNYVKVMAKIIITCKTHGDFEQLANSHLNGRGCPICARNTKKNTAQFVKESKTIHGNTYIYRKTVYNKATEKLTITCKMHGDFEQTPVQHLDGQGCLKCGIISMKEKLTKTTPDYIRKANKIHNNKYDYTKTKYVGKNTPIIIICKTHGEFLQRPGDHINGRHGCPTCAGNQRKTTDQFITEANVVHGNIYTYSNTSYKNSKTDLVVTCPQHGDFHITPQEHLIGRGCSTCNVSSGQLEVIQYVNSLGLKTIINDRNIIKPYEIDIIIPELNIGIEYHGSYWHSYQSNETIEERMRHSIKCDMALASNHQLLQVYDYEWMTKKEIVKSIISIKLKKAKIYIPARKCTIKAINNVAAQEFFNSNHLQGYRHAGITYALVNNDDIICAMSFSKHSKYQWEIIRLATKQYTICNGGASRLLQHFKVTKSPKSILTYADRRYSTGSVYTTCGFSKNGITQPGYVYVAAGRPPIIISRYKCQKHKLHKLLGDSFDNNLTEAQNMFNNKYRRLWDAGHYRYIA